MLKPLPKTDMARLEARVPAALYAQLRRAAELKGMTLSAYVVATVGEDARRTVEQAEVLRLGREDQIRFAEALIHPPKPSRRLIRAAKRHAALVQPR